MAHDYVNKIQNSLGCAAGLYEHLTVKHAISLFLGSLFPVQVEMERKLNK